MNPSQDQDEQKTNGKVQTPPAAETLVDPEDVTVEVPLPQWDQIVAWIDRCQNPIPSTVGESGTNRGVLAMLRQRAINAARERNGKEDDG